jgi:hypothetical protein
MTTLIVGVRETDAIRSAVGRRAAPEEVERFDLREFGPSDAVFIGVALVSDDIADPGSDAAEVSPELLASQGDVVRDWLRACGAPEPDVKLWFLVDGGPR